MSYPNKGTLQIVVNLCSNSVEHSAEPPENRYSNVLKSDLMNADEIITKAKADPMGEGLDDAQIIEMVYARLTELVDQLGSMTSFLITRHGNPVRIRAEDISFVTIETTGVFRDAKDAAE